MAGRIVAPDRVHIGLQSMDAPYAQPLSIVLQKPGEMQVVAIGGLTKLEMLAGQIAAGMVQHASNLPVLESVARESVDLAIAVMARCQQVTDEQLDAKQQAEHEAAVKAGVVPSGDESPKSNLIL